MASPSPSSVPLSTPEVLDLIFRDPAVRHGLAEFRDLKKKPHEIITIYPKEISSGKGKGETILPKVLQKKL